MRRGKIPAIAVLLSLGQITVAGAAESRLSGARPSGIKGVDNRVVADSSIAPYFLPNGIVDQQKRRLRKTDDWAVLKLRKPMNSKIKPIPLADFT